MGSLNRVTLIGHLGRDAEIRYTTGGAAVANFTMATSESWKDKDGAKQDRTEWHKIVLWGKLAESLQDYLKKGKQIYVEGRLQTKKWKDKDERDRYTTEIHAQQVVLLGGGKPSRTEDEQPIRNDDAGMQEGGSADLDDIPF